MLIKALFPLTVIGLLSMSLAGFAYEELNYGVIDLDRACGFLVHQYVPDIGLLREAYSNSDDYKKAWINVNIIAAEALAVCGKTHLASLIKMRLSSDYWNYLRPNKWEALLGIPISDTPQVERILKLREYPELGITVMVELRDAGNFTGWDQYADLLLYESINAVIKGKRNEAWKLLDKALEYFDGWGFRDEVFDDKGKYDAYKLALAVYAYRALGEPQEFKDTISRILNILKQLQDQVSGGIFTDYKAVNGTLVFGPSVSDRNVETTAITILALYANITRYLGHDCPGHSEETGDIINQQDYLPAVSTALVTVLVVVAAISLACLNVKNK